MSGTLHHIMVRGIERMSIFRDDTDRAEFLVRLAGLVERGAITVYAWPLLPNHALGGSGLPAACHLLKGSDMLWPIVKRSRVEVRAVRPH